MENYLQSIHPILSQYVILQWIARFLLAICLTLLVRILLRTISCYLRPLAEKTSSIWDDVFVDLIDGFRAFVILIGFFFLLTLSLEKSEVAHKSIIFSLVISTVWQVGVWGLHVLKAWHRSIFRKRIEQDPASSAAISLFYTGIQVIFIATLVLIGLSNLGIDITALIAGLGVGGIAVALAAQNILGDLLASLSIVLDKPFVVGDFVVAGKEKGTVEHIGIKTTRLRSLSGEELVLSNKDLLESRIQNFKRMWVRRVVQNFGVVYSTSPELLEKIPTWVEEIIKREPKLQFDRCHFCAYGNSSLDFELVFFVSDPEYNVFMDLQQRVLLSIFRKFLAERVEFAFPTQSLYLEKVPNFSHSNSELRLDS